MTKLSKTMLAAMHEINREGKVNVGPAYPGEPFRFNEAQGLAWQTMKALWERGLVFYDIDVRLSPAGRNKIEPDLRAERAFADPAPCCTEDAPCCDRRNVYNGFGSDGPLSFLCPKSCMCHD